GDGTVIPCPAFPFQEDDVDAPKETKARRAERLKGELNPWEAYDDIVGYLRTGFDTIPPAWLKTYLRWWGVYTQGDGVGVVGGTAGAGKSTPYFVVRIRIPNGVVARP